RAPRSRRARGIHGSGWTPSSGPPRRTHARLARLFHHRHDAVGPRDLHVERVARDALDAPRLTKGRRLDLELAPRLDEATLRPPRLRHLVAEPHGLEAEREKSDGRDRDRRDG